MSSLLQFEYEEDTPSDFRNTTNTLHTFASYEEQAPVKKRETTTYVRLPIHTHIESKLDRFIATNKIPHIIFHGASGTGKLTLVKEFLHKIYRGDKAKLKSHVMTVNCSHGKGIQFIRDDLKFFAKTNITAREFKSIVLLNAHHLTVDAQSALRRCIELFSYNTRFFLVLENKSKLLNPILSRFCDIYVPEYVDPTTGLPVNLHIYHLNQVYPFHQDTNAIIDAQLENVDFANGSVLMDFANGLYESGVSCMDLIAWVQSKRDRWTELEYADALMCFHTVKSDFRCEKLLMMYMLDYLFRRGG